MKICIINHPAVSNNYTPLENLVQVLSSIEPNIVCIYGENEYNHHKNKKNINHILIKNNENETKLGRIINYIKVQVEISKQLIFKKKEIDTCIFFIGGDTLLLPVVCARLLNKKVVQLLASFSIIAHEKNGDTLTLGLKILRPPCLALSNNIIVYTPNLMKVFKLEPYRHKILIAGEHFLDFTTFTNATPYTDRPPLIGYIGRLSGEKGAQHFAKALPAILNDSDSDGRHPHHQDLRAFIGGDGQLKESIEASLQAEGLTDRVDLPGWISRDNLPGYLNQLRLLVLPSYTEGLPNIMLEAMACGTPVLATPVGAIPDVLIDGKTGFIMENNTPEYIAENVKRALACPELEEIAEAGRRFVEEEYRFEKVVERWRGILTDI